MRLAVLAPLAAVVGVSGCADGAESLVASVERNSEVETAAVRPGEESRMEALAIGTLRADPATGCLWLEGDDGQPTGELLLQGDSYRVDFSSSPSVVLDGEAVVGTVGEVVELGGGYTESVEGVDGCPVTGMPFLGYFEQR